MECTGYVMMYDVVDIYQGFGAVLSNYYSGYNGYCNTEYVWSRISCFVP